MKIIAVVFATMILPHAVSAKTIIMDCDGTYFKYSKSFWKNAEVAVRKDADWEPWCAESIKITDEGATCGYAVEQEIGETVYEYAYVDKNYIEHARKELSQRHSFCKSNSNNKLCEARDRISWGEALDAINSDGNNGTLYENKRPKPTWSFGCYEPEGPNHEENNFYDLPLSVYQKMHLPKLGAQGCSISSNFVVSEIKKTNGTDLLDFLLLSQKVGIRLSERKMANGNDLLLDSREVKCQLIE
jgi:hypothetical protein